MLATLWEYRSLIGWAVAALVVLAVLGFLRPVLDVFTRTYLEIVLPLAKKVIASPYGLAVVAGVAFVIWTGAWWYFSDRNGYARAKGECNAEIATRERDAALATVARLREQLARVQQIQLQDATQAMANAERDRQNESELNALPDDPRACLTADDARRLWGPK